tara:strand:+ start:711 stop:1001 length:291 start_codon:yes stop_codon:yes gene_type:complete
MNKEFLNNKLSYKVVGNDELKRWEKGQIWYLVDKHLDSTDEYIDHDETLPIKQRKKKNYNYEYHLMTIESCEWLVLDQDNFDSFKLYADFYIDGEE